MRHFNENLLVRFSIVSFVILLVLAVVISTIVSMRLHRNVELLNDHGAAMRAGTVIQPTDAFSIPSLSKEIKSLRWMTYGVVGGGFVVLYTGLVFIVWGGWKTIQGQRRELEAVNAELRSRVEEIEGSNEQLRFAISERERVERELVQSQKMEAVGKLAGGVAHDFNNLLTPMIGYTHLAMSALPAGNESLRENLRQIQRAADRAANIVQQLQAFSRHQIVEPRVVDMNGVILDLDGMLRRLIGEDIELVMIPAPDAALVKVDPRKMDQVLLNLVVNARDAMPDGGTLVIESTNIYVADQLASPHLDATAGKYVMLTVRDTGVGMTEEVKEHAFEPFFPTKDPDKGTGLGLSTCYATVAQFGGNIRVESELGRGTTFTIYLPMVEGETDPLTQGNGPDELPVGTGTVLLAEDEPLVREFAAEVLRKQGYTVLEAENGHEALRAAGEYLDKRIDLLLTDIVMPLLGGRRLAELISESHPEVRVLYMSGYTDDAAVDRDTLALGGQFMPKPFTPMVLASKVRDILAIDYPQPLG